MLDEMHPNERACSNLSLKLFDNWFLLATNCFANYCFVWHLTVLVDLICEKCVS